MAENNTIESFSRMGKEQRIFTRIPFECPVRWHDAYGEEGSGAVRDVSRSGLSLSLGRYLRPGPAIIFTFDDIEFGGEPVSIPALNVWCRPDADKPDQFHAGFSVIHGEAQVLGSISEVFYTALRKIPASRIL